MDNKTTYAKNINNFLYCIQETQEKLNKVIADVKDIEIKFDWAINFVNKWKCNVDHYADILREERKEYFEISLNEIPPYETVEKVECINDKLYSLEELGVTFVPQDFLYLGYCFYQRNFYEKAINEFNEALNLNHHLLEAYYFKTASLLNLRRYDEALETINSALEIDPNNTTLMLKKTNIFYKQGKYEEIIPIYDNILIECPNNSKILFGKANIFSKLKRNEEAIEFFHKAQSESPESKEILFRRVSFLRKLNRHEEAIKAFDIALEVSKDDSELWLKKSILLSHYGKDEDSLLACQKVLEIDPDNTKALYKTSDILIKLGRYEEALDYFDKALSLKPDDPRAWAYRGRLYTNLGEYEEATKSIEKSLELKPKYIEALFNKGYLFFEIKDYEKALDTVNEILEIKSASLKALNYKTKILFKLKRYQELISTLDEILEFNIEDAEIWFLRATAFANLNEDEKALTSFEISSMLDPFNCNTWINKASILSKINRLDEALEAYDKALKLEPYSSKVWNSKGFVLSKLGDYEQALKSYDKALELNSYGSRIWENKGFTLSKLGEYEEALKSYDRAIELDPYKSRAWENKGFTLSKLGKYEEALENYNKAIELDPSKPGTWDSNGFALSKLGKYEEALKSYDKALEMDPERPKTLDNKAFALSKLERYQESLDIYNKALNMNPNDAKILSKLTFVLSKLGKNEEALQVLENLLKVEPNNDNSWYEKGVILSKLGKRDEALQAFAMTLEVKNRKNITPEKSGYLCTEMDLEDNRAERNEIESNEIESNEIESNEIESNEIESNEIESNEIESNEIESNEIESNEIESNGSKGSKSKNSKLKERNVELNDSNSIISKSYWYDKGTELLNLEKYEEAIESFENALKINPFLSKIWFAIGLSRGKHLLQLSNNKDSIQTLKSKGSNSTKGSTEDYKLNKFEEILKTFNSGFKLQSIEEEKTFGSVIVQLDEYEKIIENIRSGLPELNRDYNYLFPNKNLLISDFVRCEKNLDNLCVNPTVCETTKDSNFSSNECLTQNEKIVSLSKNSFDEDYQQKENSHVEEILNYYPDIEDHYKESVSYSSFRGITNDNSNCLTRLLDPSNLTGEVSAVSPNFYNISKDIINGNYGLTFEEFHNRNLNKVPVVQALAKADDELLLYKYYTNDNIFIPSLKRIDFSYKPEYEKLENWFCDYFFNILGERVSTEGEEIGIDYYEKLERNFINFRYSIDDTIQYLGLKKNREKYLGSDNINFMLLFFKKVIRSQNISPDCVDVAGKVFIPGSAMFFLELYSLLRNVDILDIFQKTVEGMRYENKIKLVTNPRVLIIPWPHQREAFEKWESNERNGIVQMATATGKTLVGLMAIEALSKAKNKAIVRIFAHSTAILNQWRREVIEKLGLLSNIQGDYTKTVYCNGLSIHFNTLQSVYKNPEYYPADLLIVDEVHHLAAQQYSKALSIKCDWKMGLSATIEGERLNILEEKLGPVVYNFSLKEALEKGILPKFEWKLHTVYLSIEEKTEFDNISRKIIELYNFVRFDYKFINEVSDGKIETIENLYDFVQLVEKARYRGKKLPENWKQLQLSIIQRRWIIHRSKPKIDDAIVLAKKYLSLKHKIVIFTMDIATCESIARELERYSENVYMAHSKLKENVNENILKFKNAQYGVLIGARMLDEGIDIPDAEIGINVSASKTRLQLIQRIGRVLRMKEGKRPVFHHYIAIPERGSHVKVDDDLVMIDDLSWIQDTALKMGVNAELIDEEQSLERLRLEAEEMIRENYSKKQRINLPSYGTLKVENILGMFPDFAIHSIIDKLSELDFEHQISDTEWSDIVRKAHGKEGDEPLIIPGYWWILLLGERNPVRVKEIFQRFQNTISIDVSMN